MPQQTLPRDANKRIPKKYHPEGRGSHGFSNGPGYLVDRNISSLIYTWGRFPIGRESYRLWRIPNDEDGQKDDNTAGAQCIDERGGPPAGRIGQARE